MKRFTQENPFNIEGLSGYELVALFREVARSTDDIELLKGLSVYPDYYVQESVIKNTHTPKEVLRDMIDHLGTGLYWMARERLSW